MAQTKQTGNEPEGSVLDGLDSSSMTGLYWYLATLACIGGFLFGYDTAIIGSVLDFIPYELSPSDRLPRRRRFPGRGGRRVASPARSPTSSGESRYWWPTRHLCRRRDPVRVDVNADHADLRRTLIGLAVGADSAIATAYIAEFAPKGRRGALSLLQQWMITVGIFVSYVMALWSCGDAGRPENPTGGSSSASARSPH